MGASGDSGYTTVMLRNIPNKYTREMLVKQLNQDFKGRFDFVYLPIDFKNKPRGSRTWPFSLAIAAKRRVFGPIGSENEVQRGVRLRELPDLRCVRRVHRQVTLDQAFGKAFRGQRARNWSRKAR